MAIQSKSLSHGLSQGEKQLERPCYQGLSGKLVFNLCFLENPQKRRIVSCSNSGHEGYC